MAGVFQSQLVHQRANMGKAMIFHEAGKPFELREVPLPDKLKEGDLLVELDVATICGSDLHTHAGKRMEPAPLVLGHEGVGFIHTVGSDIINRNPPRVGSAVKEGDRITFSIADSCGTCAECRLHKLPQKCISLMKYGHANWSDGTGLNGTYGSHVVVRRGTHIVKLPDKLSSRVAAPANCAMATVVNSLDVSRLPRFGANNSAVVQGAGLLGIYAVAWLRYKVQMGLVFCLDTNQDRLDTAAKFGAIPILVSGGQEEMLEREKMIRQICPHGVDVVVEMTGAKSVLTEGVNLLRNGGHYAFCGAVHPDSQLSSLTGEAIIRKCLTIRGAHNYTPWNLDEAVRFMSDTSDKLPFEAVLSPKNFKLSELDKAFEKAYSGRHCRVVVQCDS